jgi:hypothetical protein
MQMNDPRDESSPYWLQTVAPFGAAPDPQGPPAKMLWEYPLLHQVLASMLDSSKVPIPPARAPIFPASPASYPPMAKTPVGIEEEAEPPASARGILSRFSQPVEPPPQVPATIQSSYSSPPVPSSWNPSSPSLWHRPVTANVEFPALAPIDDDPFARAAHRTRQSVRPTYGRPPGAATAILQNLLPATVQSLATLPQRATEAAGNLQRTGEYDPGPGLEAAMLMVGSPSTPVGALGSAARRPPRLPMDEASRMARAEAMGFRRNMPVEYGTAPAGEKIAAAAFNANGRVFTAPMHYEALENAERELGVPYSQMQHAPIPEGFVTNSGRYVSRLEAADIARRARQAEGTGIWGDELTSEDTAMSGIKPSSKVRTGATAPGLPGGQGVWGWVLPGEAASIPPSASRPRTRRHTAMANSGIRATEGAAIPPAPIWHRAERLFPLDARGLHVDEIQTSLKEAWNQGHDAVILKIIPHPAAEVEIFWSSKTPHNSALRRRDSIQRSETAVIFRQASPLSWGPASLCMWWMRQRRKQTMRRSWMRLNGATLCNGPYPSRERPGEARPITPTLIRATTSSDQIPQPLGAVDRGAARGFECARQRKAK